MNITDSNYNAYVELLKEELVPVTGCTEPIAIAFAAATARKILGEIPVKAIVKISNSIIKNVKSVVVPNTGGLKGIEVAVAVGIIAGIAEEKLQVISSVTEEQIATIKPFLDSFPIVIIPTIGTEAFEIDIELFSNSHRASVIIKGHHTNIVYMEKDGTELREKCSSEVTKNALPKGFMTVEGIFKFAENVVISDIYDTIKKQIELNTAISEEGLTGKWGAAIGKTIMDYYGTDVKIMAQAAAAAGSDARMSGCKMPVVINSGSGNQGLTASLPVIQYWNYLEIPEEKLYRSLVLSNLLTIHLKEGIGKLSAYCGAVSAGCAAGAGIAYLSGGGYSEVIHTLVNALAIVSGIICDGAKPSCAAKIASSVNAGILGWQMYLHGKQFYGGDGIVRKGVEETIRAVSRVGHDGMCETDKEIVRIMTEIC